MNRFAFNMQITSLCLYCALLTAAAVSSCLGESYLKPIPGSEIDRLVIEVLLRRAATQQKVIFHIDLTGPFRTANQWTFVVAQENGQPTTEVEDQGSVHMCLVRSNVPDCSEDLYKQAPREQASFDIPHHLFASSVLYAGQSHSTPLLFVQSCGAEAFNGNCGIATALYQYDRGADRFIRVFLNLTGRNNNQATRFVERGPLQGYVIVDYPTENAPYTYWVEVYRAGKSGLYVQVLRYRGRTGYGDGNPLTVIDSEMPAVLSHLGLWRRDDPLPIPYHLPKGCNRLYMRQNEEWCK